MKLYLLLIALLAFSIQAEAQNEIDHYSTIWPSGYGKMAIDGDTLYLNIMNGQGVERYFITNPANPVYIDREEISGFDQIDFERRVMAKESDGRLVLTNFADFSNPQEILRLDLSEIGGGLASWKVIGDAIFTISHDDTIRAYDISDPGNPHISSVCGLIREPDNVVSFGSDICISISPDPYNPVEFLDIYDLRNHDQIQYSYTFRTLRYSSGYCYTQTIKGDTISVSTYSSMGPHGDINIYCFTLSDTIPSNLWQTSGYYSPPVILPGVNGFLIETLYGTSWRFYSLNNFTLLGEEHTLNSPNFGITPNDNVLFLGSNYINVFQPSYSNSPMTIAYADTLESYGILSSCAYGDYVLTGAESNGGELLVHSIGDDGDLFHSGTLPGVPAKDMIVDSTTVFCLCTDKLVAADFINPEHPSIRHEITGFNGTLVDFTLDEGYLYVVTDRAYSIIQYDDQSGFALIGTLDLPGAPIISIVHYFFSYVLRGRVGTVLKIDPNIGGQPEVAGEYRLPHENYNNMDLGRPGLWASGDSGTDVVSLFFLQPLNYYGPEYFADARRFYFSNDTLYVADGVGGIKVFTSNWGPSDPLTYIGGYGTGNVVNQMAMIERNFYISDYYSLQHLRWGAPTGIESGEESIIPNEFSLEQNYPNPFNSSTSISFAIPDGQQSTLNIYDICGRAIRAYDIRGKGNLVWDGRDLVGRPVSSGVYFYTIAGQPSTARKMLLVK